MAFLKFNDIRVAGVAACVPSHVEPTISTSTAYDREAYMATTGILEKRWSNDFTASDLCQAAAEKLLDELGVSESGYIARMLRMGIRRHYGHVSAPDRSGYAPCACPLGRCA